MPDVARDLGGLIAFSSQLSVLSSAMMRIPPRLGSGEGCFDVIVAVKGGSLSADGLLAARHLSI